MRARDPHRSPSTKRTLSMFRWFQAFVFATCCMGFAAENRRPAYDYSQEQIVRLTEHWRWVFERTERAGVLHVSEGAYDAPDVTSISTAFLMWDGAITWARGAGMVYASRWLKGKAQRIASWGGRAYMRLGLYTLIGAGVIELFASGTPSLYEQVDEDPFLILALSPKLQTMILNENATRLPAIDQLFAALDRYLCLPRMDGISPDD